MEYKRYIEACELAEVIENLDIRVAGQSARWYDAKHSVLREITQAPDANVREIEYAEWYYDPNGMDWGLGAWKCSKCHTKNDNLGMGNNINPYMFSGSKFCPQCGAIMKPKEKETSK